MPTNHLDFEVQHLECRVMLAGDVTAAVVGGSLVVRGDNSGNELTITSTSEAGTLLIQGVDDTTINGGSSQLVEGVTRNIRVNLKGGDNAILLKRSTFTSFNVDGRVSIRSGNGNDVVGIFALDVGGRTSINVRGGDDFVSFSNGRTRGLSVNTGSGDNVADLHNSNHLKSFLVRTGAGDDVVKSSFNQFFVAANSIQAGSGNDLVDVSHSQFNTRRAPRINGQSGNDGFYGAFTFATGNRTVGFEYDLSIGEINDSIEAHIGSDVYNYLFSYGDGTSET